MEILINIPDSEIKTVLFEKMNENNEKYADLLNELHRVCDHISKELRYINELFPEYTPHDKDYHIKNLFRISDVLLGTHKYRNMNFIELYILIVAMYAHDWGMAVSKTERNYIATNKIADNANKFNLLSDENERFKKYITHELGQICIKSDADIDIKYWQDYIRQTHALRSGIRIEKYYENISGSVAGAVSKVCIGHWQNIEEISEKNGFYKDTAVFGESVNLIALSIYIRLIDLFDLSEDRTPYIIWKYVNPKDEFSKMEWNKHRALRPITCPPYEQGRIICISGSTDNQKVYASLCDLKNVCEKYFKECSEALAHMNDKRHELGVYFLEWRLEARGFRPISVQFDFDRKHVFDILSEEVYSSHPYVFIRELLQNSIDAITMRKEVLNKKRIGGENIGSIKIEFKKVNDDDFEVYCTDDGIGMDEYIIKNYFSVIGKSYYQSKDFLNKSLQMKPISRFGIGILSCFSIANEMEIVTFREPYLREGNEGLRIVISDMKQQFRIETMSDYACEVGTKIILRIKKQKLERLLERNEMKINEFCVKNYLSSIAKFVPYPICIRENNNNTIIISPSYEINKLYNDFSDIDNYELIVEKNNYPFEDEFLIQDIEKGIECFDSRLIDIENDLNLEDIEGSIIFAILNDNYTNIINDTQMWPAHEVLIESKDHDRVRVRWKKELYDGKFDNIQIYNNGILIEKNDERFEEEYYRLRSDLFPRPIVKINLKNAIQEEITVSRFDYRNDKKLLLEVWDSLLIKIADETKEKINKLSYYNKMKLIALNCLQYYIDPGKFVKIFINIINLPFIVSSGKIEYLNINEMEEIVSLPSNKNSNIMHLLHNNKELDPLIDWPHEDCVISDFDEQLSRPIFYERSIIKYIDFIIKIILNDSFKVYKLKILPINNYENVVIQFVLRKGNIKSRLDGLLTEWGLSEKYHDILDVLNMERGINQVLEYEEAFGDYCFVGCKYKNINHPYIVNILKYVFFLAKLELEGYIENKELATNKDCIFDLPFFDNKDYDEKKIYSISDINESVNKFRLWISHKFPQVSFEECTLKKEFFIPNTIKWITDDKFKKIRLDFGKEI